MLKSVSLISFFLRSKSNWNFSLLFSMLDFISEYVECAYW